MKPYKVANTWIDLDRVIAIEDELVVPHNEFKVSGCVITMFRDNHLYICLGSPDWANDELRRGGTKMVPSAKSIQEWQAFKTAWMNKDKKE